MKILDPNTSIHPSPSYGENCGTRVSNYIYEVTLDGKIMIRQDILHMKQCVHFQLRT